MRIDYDQEPEIQPFQGVEKGVQQYWDVSHAVKGTRGHSGRYTVGRVFEILRPLSLQVKSPSLKRQSEELSSLVVHGKSRRVTQPPYGTKKIVCLRPVTNNSVPAEKVA